MSSTRPVSRAGGFLCNLFIRRSYDVCSIPTYQPVAFWMMVMGSWGCADTGGLRPTDPDAQESEVELGGAFGHPLTTVR